jgi:lipopolysaccharide/colanic/teichoic acid biosynthesis glycosyltransferase
MVKATSRGPALFVQERVGRHGEVFRLVKFRTMRVGTHLEVREDPAVLAGYLANDFKLPPDDPRITRVGRWLRRTSLDEVPQLINVLRGEMSIVGVRPLVPEELALRSEYDQALYRSFRPGMTGLWQVEGRSTVQKEDRQHLDRRYLETWSLWNDAIIMLRTPGAVFRISHAH